MSATPVTIGATPRSHPAARGGCPFAHGCTCVFDRGPVRRDHDSTDAAEARGGEPLTARGQVHAEKSRAVDGASTLIPSAAPRVGRSMPTELPAGVSEWTDWGWTVVEIGSPGERGTEVTLERRRTLGFCANLGLTVATGFVWLAVWITQTRHPRFDTVTLTVRSNGRVTASPVTRRRA
jgi:hypothetical protein